jgi:hypothetical protein
VALGREVAVPHFEAVLGGVRAREPEWFNEDQQLKEGMVAVLDSKDEAVAHAVREWARQRSPKDKAGLAPHFPAPPPIPLALPSPLPENPLLSVSG